LRRIGDKTRSGSNVAQSAACHGAM